MVPSLVENSKCFSVLVHMQILIQYTLVHTVPTFHRSCVDSQVLILVSEVNSQTPTIIIH